jgi:Spy/CpxP family protein refolding chaperone
MSTDLLERTTLRRGWDPRVACALVLGLVFLCGAAAGALVMDMDSGLHARLHQPAFGTPAYFERLQKELDLTPAQSEQMRSILSDMWQYYRTVISESRSRVDQILTPQQRDKFEQLLQQQLK